MTFDEERMAEGSHDAQGAAGHERTAGWRPRAQRQVEPGGARLGHLRGLSELARLALVLLDLPLVLRVRLRRPGEHHTHRHLLAAHVMGLDGATTHENKVKRAARAKPQARVLV